VRDNGETVQCIDRMHAIAKTAGAAVVIRQHHPARVHRLAGTPQDAIKAHHRDP
jgi:hypothetical protein